VVDIVSVDNVSVDVVSVWGTVLLVHRAGRFCRISLSMAAHVVWTRSVLELERVWWSLTVVVEEEMIPVAGVVLPWEVISCYILTCYIFDEVGGLGGGAGRGGSGREGGSRRSGRGIPRTRDESVLIVSVSCAGLRQG